MMTRLTGMDVSNASLYDGATALAEAVLMAERCMKKGPRRVLVPRSVHPAYRKTLHTIVALQDIEVVEFDFAHDGAEAGGIDPAWLAEQDFGAFTALVIPQPNFFGVLEHVDALTDWAHAKGALVIGVVNPVSLAVLKPPGEWGTASSGKQGADIVCGDGQPLGVPLSSGGPYFGILCCKQEFVRQMPGRIVGRTTDLDGREGFALTLQAREQHIRRAKATSNICTNQGLLVTAATITMAMLGPEGVRRIAANSMANTRTLRDKLTSIPGVRALFARTCFHEVALASAEAGERDRSNVSRTKISSPVSRSAKIIRSSATHFWSARRRPRRAPTSTVLPPRWPARWSETKFFFQARSVAVLASDDAEKTLSRAMMRQSRDACVAQARARAQRKHAEAVEPAPALGFKAFARFSFGRPVRIDVWTFRRPYVCEKSR